MKIVFGDGTERRIGNQYLVSQYANKYLSMDVKIIGEDFVINVPFTGICDGCGKEYDSLPKSTVFMSEDSSLNQRLQRIGRVCVVCYYKRYYDLGHAVPPLLIDHF